MTLARTSNQAKEQIVTTSSTASSATTATSATTTTTTTADYRPDAQLVGKEKLSGRTTTTRRLVLQISLIGLLIGSIFVNYALLYIDIIEHLVLYNMCLRNSTDAFKYWKEPPVKPLLKVYIFNYTNVERYHDHSDAKLMISEIGPFVYEEHLERVNIRINESDDDDDDNDRTISYQEKRDFRYRDDLSTGLDRFASITAPNLPMLTAVAKTSNAYFMTKLGVSAFLSGLNSEPFVTIPAHDYLWGYDDSLYRLSRNLLPAKYIGMATEHFGVLAKRKGISPNRYVIKSGVRNPNEIGNLIRMNDQSFLPYWDSHGCSYASGHGHYGSDGSKFSLDAIRKRAPVQIFSPDLCRHLQYEFRGTVNLFNSSLPALHYELPDRTFDCACDAKAYATCSPLRILNLTECARGAPTFLSFPCFRHANQTLQSRFGSVCHQSDSTHKSFINIHPKYGFSMSAQNSFQINVLAKGYAGFSQMRMFHEDLILPVVYVQMEFDESTIPDHIYKIFYDLTYTIPMVNTSLKVVSVLTTLLLIVLLVRMSRK